MKTLLMSYVISAAFEGHLQVEGSKNNIEFVIPNKEVDADVLFIIFASVCVKYFPNVTLQTASLWSFSAREG